MSDTALRPPPGPDLYETGLCLWTQAQAALPRAGRRQEIDLQHLAEAIESVGGSQKSEIRNRLAILLQHLLKWEFQPETRRYGRRSSIAEQRLQIDGLINVGPSLRAFPDVVLAKSDRLARVRAAEETGLGEPAFPDTCPYALAQILDDGFSPGPAETEVV